MKLIGANRSLRLVTSSAANLDVVALHATQDGAATAQGDTLTKISSATTTTIVAAPSAGQERTVYALTIQNRHASLSNTVRIEMFDGTSAFSQMQAVLAPGEVFAYDGFGSWRVFSAQGSSRFNQNQGSLAAALNDLNTVVLAADVVNANAVANTLQDIPGLAFPVIAGETYQFEFTIDFTAAALTTGSRFTINGPSASRLAYQSTWALTQTSNTIGNCAAYDQPAAANASSANTTGNIAFIIGEVTPAADGNIVARFASEVASSAITAKAGSLLKWMRTR